MKNKERVDISKEIRIALLTILSIILGVVGSFIYYCYDAWIYAFVLLYVLILVLLTCIYLGIKKKFGNEEWPDSIIITSIIIPLIIGSCFSMGISG